MCFKITLVMPTYNRSECINYFIEHSIKKYHGVLFRFEIHDSSTDDKTKNLVETANLELENKINYYKYDSTINGDAKTFSALSRVTTKYIYLIGDGFSPDFNKLEEMLICENFEFYDLIGLFFRYNNKQVNKKYPLNNKIYIEYDKDYIFKNITLFLTLYGATIVSTKMFTYINENNLFEKFNFNGRYSFAYALSLLEALITSQFNLGVSFAEIDKNPYKKGNWAHDENFFKIFYEEFVTDFDKVSNYSIEDKNVTLKNIAKYHFTYIGIIHYKFRNVFCLKYMNKYKKYVKRFSNHYWFMWLVTLTPKWLLSIFYYPAKWSERALKKILRRG